MKKILVAAVAALASTAGSAVAADLVTKAKPVVAAPVSAWDIAFGSSIVSDYVFRGITQSNHKPSVSTYFEPRYNINPNLQLYAGIAGESISLPNRAAAEIDLYGGIRPTVGPLAFDFGFWYYWYPGGQNFPAVAPLPNGNTIKGDLSFYEVYAKVSYNVTDAFVLGANFYYTPSFLNSGADGEYLSATAKYTFPALSNGVAIYLSGEFGRQWFGTTDSFYGFGPGPFVGGIPYADYNTWNIGIGWTYKVFTVDLRYSDTDLSKGNCNAFTGDHTAGGATAITNINPGGLSSKWCGSAFIAKLGVDLTLNTNIK